MRSFQLRAGLRAGKGSAEDPGWAQSALSLGPYSWADLIVWDGSGRENTVRSLQQTPEGGSQHRSRVLEQAEAI